MFLLFGALAFILICAELALRFSGFAPGELRLFRENPHGTGSYRLRANMETGVRFGQTTIALQTNEAGMRSHTTREHAGAKRVAFVGDSFTFGLWASESDRTFVSVFDAVADEFDALNFGVPGYGLLDAELLIREELSKLKPRCIVLVFYNGNDFFDTYLGLNRYHVRRNGVLGFKEEILVEKIPESWRRERPVAARKWIEKIHLLRLVKAALKPFAEPRLAPGRRAAPDRSFGSNVFWSRREYPEFALRAKQVSFAALKRIDDYCSSRGIEFCIAALPSVEQVHAPETFGAEYAIELPQQHLETFARAHSIPFLDLFPPLREHAERTGEDLYVLADGHLNDRGHRMVGEQLAAFLRALNL